MSSPPPSLLTYLAQADRLQLLIEAVKDYAIYLLDADGYVATWNAGAERFKGYVADEIVGRHFSVFYTPEDRADGKPEEALRTAAQQGRFESEGWRLRKDGTRFWTHVIIDPVYGLDNQVIGFAKVTRDITEKKAADDALLESERRFRLLVQGVKDYAIYMLDPQGRVTNWNSGAQAIKRYSADDIVGQHFSVFYTDDDRAAGEPERALATALREGKYEGEVQRVRKGGERFWAHVLIDPIHADDGRLVGFAKVTRDVSQQREARLELEASREALARAQRMEAVGHLTGGLAHDFNNLLTIILASADILRRPQLSEDKRVRYLNAITETASRAAALTSQLLAFARRQPLTPEVFDVGEALEGMRHMIGTVIGSTVSLDIQAPPEPLLVEADPNQFETAVLNMLINARDAMPRGGRITVSMHPADGVPPVRNHAGAPGDFVALSISDTGEGMAPETLARIFDPFFTTKPGDLGTGLGLSQVYGYAKQSRGEISVSSLPGQGATFTLFLPRVRTRPSTPPAPLETPPGTLRSHSILMVEDNESVGNFASGLLRDLGQTVTWASDAASALAILSTRRDEIDVVFTDVVMPGMNGIELAQQVRILWPDLPVILTSGYSHVLADEGHQGFPLLRKPYSIDDLIGILDRFAALRRGAPPIVD